MLYFALHKHYAASMKDYNGFASSQRNKAQRWLNAQWARGSLPRPVRCVACGQDQGVIDAHAEDYSEPFAPCKTDGFHLCFVCHMMVHCRHRNEARWQEYRQHVETGSRPKAFVRRDWPRFQKGFLGAVLAPELFERGPAQVGRALRKIELSQERTAQRLVTIAVLASA